MEDVNVDRSIGRLEGKVDIILTDMSKLRSSFEVLEAGRLSRVETAVAGLVVKVAYISASLSFGISILAFLIEKYLIK